MARSLMIGGGEAASAKRRAERVCGLWREFDKERDAWAHEIAKDEAFFLGDQWTEAQIRELQQKGMAPLVINRILPVILHEVAVFTAKRPSIKAYPVDDNDVRKAGFWDDVIKYVWQISNGDSEYQQAVLDYFKTGAGYLQVYVDPLSDDGRGDVKFQSLPVYDVYPDPNSRKIDLSDARAIIVSRRVDVTSLLLMYPHKKRTILSARVYRDVGPTTDRPADNPKVIFSGIRPDQINFESEFMSKNYGKVRFIECYEKVVIPHVRVYNPTLGIVRVMRETAYDPDDYGSGWVAEHFWRRMIRMQQVLEPNVLLSETFLPIDEYPIIPLFLHHTRTPFPKGDVAITRGLQLEVNKRRSIMIHNASLAGNYRIFAQKGSIANKRDYEERGTQPGFVLEYNKGFDQPQAIMPQTLPSAWIQLESEAKYDIEYSLSVFANMMGSSVDAPETYRALLALEEAGHQKIQYKAQHARHALRQLGRVIMGFCRFVYNRPKLLVIVGDEETDPKTVWLNQLEVDPRTGVRRKINDTTVGRFDVLVTDSTSMPTNRMALLNLYMELYQLGIIDREEVLKKTDVRDRDEVLKRVAEAEQLKGQIQALVQENKNLAGLNQTMKRQAQQLEVHLAAEKGKQKIVGEVERTVAEQRIARARINDQLRMLANEIALRKKKLDLDAGEVLLKARIEQEKRLAMMEVENARRRVRSGD